MEEGFGLGLDMEGESLKFYEALVVVYERGEEVTGSNPVAATSEVFSPNDWSLTGNYGPGSGTTVASP